MAHNAVRWNIKQRITLLHFCLCSFSFMQSNCENCWTNTLLWTSSRTMRITYSLLTAVGIFSWGFIRYVLWKCVKICLVYIFLRLRQVCFKCENLFGGSSHAVRNCFTKNLLGLFTRAILCLAIDIVEYVFHCRERRGQTRANHKRIPWCIDCHEFITYARITIAMC